MSQLSLDLQMITVHCFACTHSVCEIGPDEAHAAMERHYAAVHRALIERLSS